MGTFIGILQEFVSTVAAACKRSDGAKAAVIACGVLVVSIVGWAAWTLLGSGSPADRYRVFDVHGEVTYVDGSAVPAGMMLVKLFPAAHSGNGPRTATPVTATVNGNTGRFQAKWVGDKDAFNAPAPWRVVVLSGDQRPMGEDVVPSEYGDIEKTPLLVDLTKCPLQIRLKRPAPAMAMP